MTAAEPTLAAVPCAVVDRKPAETRSRRVAPDCVRFAGKHFGATAIRVSAGNFRSLTSLRRNPRHDTVGWSDPIVRILSVRIVRLFGVSRFRPPRRSPGLEPLSIFHSPRPGPRPQGKLQIYRLARNFLCPARHLCPRPHSEARRSSATRSTRCLCFGRGRKAQAKQVRRTLPRAWVPHDPHGRERAEKPQLS